ncbi:putative mitochondrial chaperone bcs1 [Ananas comosus]|uniref:Putative mitochondrial chaperone bcs1 n=1 Tax=Ananas comosus TaxID=4615 RepID=A0A199W4N7_ANACO|nr:putative mitochondrial chaperone bcs1 [Ananas comosus]
MEMFFDWRSLGSFLATIMVLRTALRDFLPPELQRLLLAFFGRLSSFLHSTDTVIIDEIDSHAGDAIPNELYDSAQLYLSSRCLAASSTIRLHKSHHSPRPVASLPDHHSVVDFFHSIPLSWTSDSFVRPANSATRLASSLVGSGGGGGDSIDQRSLRIQFHRRHHHEVHNLYIPFILKEAERIRTRARERRLYTNRAVHPGDDQSHCWLWSSQPFEHPSTFDTIALDPVLKDDIRADLLQFVARRDYYTRVGRAWKRGYLLHGPPGTGKTSLVAAMANLLEFDIYDLELTTVASNSHLRRLLVSTAPKSILVIEDIDCSLDLSDRKKKRMAGGDETEQERWAHQAQSRAPARETISLTGVLNFVDGLWSSCVGERLMVFTTNHPEQLDPALLRPGRMDRKIELGSCRPVAFRTLARNYLGRGREDWAEDEGPALEDLMAKAEVLLGEVPISPAEVAEMFMASDGKEAKAAVTKVVEELQRRKEAPPPPQPQPQPQQLQESMVNLEECG